MEINNGKTLLTFLDSEKEYKLMTKITEWQRQ